MPYGKLITRFTTGGHDIFITCPAKSMHLEPFFSSPVPQKACTSSPSGSRCKPFGLSVHAFCGTGDENVIPTCRSAGNYYIKIYRIDVISAWTSVTCPNVTELYPSMLAMPLKNKIKNKSRQKCTVRAHYKRE